MARFVDMKAPLSQKLGLSLGSLTSLAQSLKIELPRHPGEPDASYQSRLHHAVRTWVQPEIPMKPPPEPIPLSVEVEEVDPIDAMADGFEPGDEDARNTLRLVIASGIHGTNADKLAQRLGLNRDKFVRPRAKRLRESGIWADGKIAVKTLNGTEEELRLGVLLAALVAEDLVAVGE